MWKRCVALASVLLLSLQLSAEQPERDELRARARAALREASHNGQQVKPEEDVDWGHFTPKLVWAQLQVGDFEGALETTALSESESAREYMIARVALAQAEAGNTDAAMQTLSLIKSVLERAQALAELAPILAKACSPEEASLVLAEALELARCGEERYGNDRHFLIRQILRTQASIGDVTGAVGAASLLENKDTKEETLRDIVKEQAKRKDFSGALQNAALLGYWKGWALGDIAVARAEAGDVEGAVEATRAISYMSTRSDALTEIGQMLVKENRIVEAIPVFREAIQTIVHNPGQYYRDLNLLDVVEAQADASLYEEAFEAIQAMVDPEWQDKGRRRVAKKQAEEGELSVAFLTAAGIKTPSERLGTFTDIAEVLAEKGDKAGVAQASRSAMEVFDNQEEARMHVAYLQALGMAQAKAGNIEDSLKTLSLMESQWRFDSVVLSDILWAHVREGNVDAARALLRAVKDEDDRVGALWGLAYEQASAGDLEGALGWASEAKTASGKMFILYGAGAGAAQYLQETEKHENNPRPN